MYSCNYYVTMHMVYIDHDIDHDPFVYIYRAAGAGFDLRTIKFSKITSVHIQTLVTMVKLEKRQAKTYVMAHARLDKQTTYVTCKTRKAKALRGMHYARIEPVRSQPHSPS